MSFPEIKRAEEVQVTFAKGANIMFEPLDIEEERQSRATWMRALAKTLKPSLGNTTTLGLDVVWTELLRQAEEDEK